jgi:integrase
MATIRKRGNKWQAQVRRINHPPLIRSFPSKSDALAWARQQEVAIDCGAARGGCIQNNAQTMSDLLTRYLREITPHKKGASSEQYRINRFLREDIANLTLKQLTPTRFATYRDKRLKEVSSAAVRREMTILSHCLEKARKEWGISLSQNPLADIERPRDSKPRTRRLTSDDTTSLSLGLKKTRNPLLALLISFAIATGLRRSEILRITWGDLDVDRATVLLSDSKNGEARRVPLSPEAQDIISELSPGKTNEQIFPITMTALRLAWQSLKHRSGLNDLRFHDLRHEAISSFFERGLSAPEVAIISGHKDMRMLFRYTHLKATDVAQKLALKKHLRKSTPSRMNS